MGIETFFFISLAVTFLLLIALVYHFHQKFVTVEQRVNNVIEIINSVVKEMQNLKSAQQQPKCCPVPSPLKNPFVSSGECINISPDSFIQTNDVSLGENVELDDNLELESEYESDYDSESEYDEADDEKIMVSDDEDNIELMDVVDVLNIGDNTVEIAETKNDDVEEIKEDLESYENSESISIISNTDFKKMDISQLRAIANAKGIDAKKMKKAEILKQLEQ